MYCIACGADNLESSARCIRCGHGLSTLRTDKYESPAVPSSSAVLWNPDVAALLSIPFSPIFGAIIHALNWRRLGESRRAAMAWLWAVFILLAFVGVALYGEVAHLNEGAIDAYLRFTQMIILPLWYFATARAQGKFVAKQLRGEYFRKGWFTPVAVAIVLIGSLYGLPEVLR